MAITSYDDIIAAHSAGGVSEDLYYCSSSGAGFLELYATIPSTTTNLTGVICNSDTPSLAPWFPFPSGDALLLNTVQQGGNGSFLTVFDMLWYGVYNNGAATATNGMEVVFDQPPLTRYTNGDGVFVLVQVVGSSGVLNASLILSLTDNLGRTGQFPAGNMRAISYSDSTALSSWSQAQVMPVPYGSGGVRKVEKFTFMTTAPITYPFAISVALVKPLCILPANAGNNTATHSFSEMCSNIIRLPRGTAGDQACLVIIGDTKNGSTDSRVWSLVAA